MLVGRAVFMTQRRNAIPAWGLWCRRYAFLIFFRDVLPVLAEPDAVRMRTAVPRRRQKVKAEVASGVDVPYLPPLTLKIYAPSNKI